jgi:hypothetical protein
LEDTGRNWKKLEETGRNWKKHNSRAEPLDDLCAEETALCASQDLNTVMIECF